MNLLLLDAHEVDADGVAVLTGRRLRHLREVLGAAPGQQLQAGIVDGARGEAEVLEIDDVHARLRVRCDQPSPRGADVLLLAVPRPKVLVRIVEHAAALGYCRVVLFRTWRVDKTHLQSRALRPEILDEHVRLGLEQARRTHRPAIELHTRFRPFVEDVLPLLPLPQDRFCAHPLGDHDAAGLQLARGAPFALAVGPEGGFLPWEVLMLAAAGFVSLRLGEHPLRTESALSALHGQLDLLRRRG